jgi:hypothetical protein
MTEYEELRRKLAEIYDDEDEAARVLEAAAKVAVTAAEAARAIVGTVEEIADAMADAVQIMLDAIEEAWEIVKAIFENEELSEWLAKLDKCVTEYREEDEKPDDEMPQAVSVVLCVFDIFPHVRPPPETRENRQRETKSPLRINSPARGRKQRDGLFMRE